MTETVRIGNDTALMNRPEPYFTLRFSDVRNVLVLANWERLGAPMTSEQQTLLDAAKAAHIDLSEEELNRQQEKWGTGRPFKLRVLPKIEQQLPLPWSRPRALSSARG